MRRQFSIRYRHVRTDGGFTSFKYRTRSNARDVLALLSELTALHNRQITDPTIAVRELGEWRSISRPEFLEPVGVDCFRFTFEVLTGAGWCVQTRVFIPESPYRETTPTWEEASRLLERIDAAADSARNLTIDACAIGPWRVIDHLEVERIAFSESAQGGAG
jgi:hypothetical protein